jgi:hypothetical protein
MKKVQLLLFSIIGTFILNSCIKPSDFDFSKMTTPVYNGEWAIPLVTSHITLRDVLTNQNSALQTDAQGLVSFVYNIKNMASQSADQLMKIPDQNLPVQNFSFQTTNPPIDLSAGKQYSTTFSADIPLTLANSTPKLDSIYIKTGTIRIPINTNFNKSATFTIQAPNIINKTTRLKIVIPTLNITQIAPNSFVTVDLSNCILILKKVSGVPNTIHFDVNMTMQGSAISSLSTYTLNMPLGITNLQFASMYGDLGQFNSNLSQTIDISLFKTNLGGGFQFAPGAISLNVNIDNSFGIPVRITATTFNAHSDSNTPHDQPINLFTPPAPNVIDVGAPTIFGQTKTTTVASTNANLGDAFNNSPNKISLVANALTNPLGPGTLNFITDKSVINVNMDLMLKFFASINNFTFQDTLSFDLNNIDQLESLALRISTTNGFPLGAKLQAYFTDQNYNVLDAMFTEPLSEILKPASLSGAPDYKTTTPTTFQFPDIVYDQTRIAKIVKAKKIILKVILNTTNNGLVKIYDSYYFDSKIAIRAKAKLQSN